MWNRPHPPQTKAMTATVTEFRNNLEVITPACGLGFRFRGRTRAPQRHTENQNGDSVSPDTESAGAANYFGLIPTTENILPVAPNSARWEKKRSVSHAVQPATIEICS